MGTVTSLSIRRDRIRMERVAAELRSGDPVYGDWWALLYLLAHVRDAARRVSGDPGRAAT